MMLPSPVTSTPFSVKDILNLEQQQQDPHYGTQLPHLEHHFHPAACLLAAADGARFSDGEEEEEEEKLSYLSSVATPGGQADARLSADSYVHAVLRGSCEAPGPGEELDPTARDPSEYRPRRAPRTARSPPSVPRRGAPAPALPRSRAARRGAFSLPRPPGTWSGEWHFARLPYPTSAPRRSASPGRACAEPRSGAAGLSHAPRLAGRARPGPGAVRRSPLGERRRTSRCPGLSPVGAPPPARRRGVAPGPAARLGAASQPEPRFPDGRGVGRRCAARGSLPTGRPGAAVTCAPPCRELRPEETAGRRGEAGGGGEAEAAESEEAARPLLAGAGEDLVPEPALQVQAAAAGQVAGAGRPCGPAAAAQGGRARAGPRRQAVLGRLAGLQLGIQRALLLQRLPRLRLRQRRLLQPRLRLHLPGGKRRGLGASRLQPGGGRRPLRERGRPGGLRRRRAGAAPGGGGALLQPGHTAGHPGLVARTHSGPGADRHDGPAAPQRPYAPRTEGGGAARRDPGSLSGPRGGAERRNGTGLDGTGRAEPAAERRRHEVPPRRAGRSWPRRAIGAASLVKSRRRGPGLPRPFSLSTLYRFLPAPARGVSQ
uniref:Uncharacterized protein n=1 Tax=Pavo cristatus TaxID=9049 RepID=A0A8C9FFL1_PAVCR